MKFLILFLCTMLCASTAFAGDPGPPDEVAPAAPEIVDVTPWIAPAVNESKPDDWGSPDPSRNWHVGLTAGQSSWDCTSNDCEVEAGSEDYETVAVAAGYTFGGWLRTEFEAGYRKHEIHGLNGPPCKRKRSHWHILPTYTSKGRAKCQTDKNLRVWDVTLGAYPTIQVYDRISFYAGGGLGIIIVEGLSQVDVAGVGKAIAGAEVRVYKGLSLDVGYKAIWALASMRLSGFDIKEYDSHGPFAGVKFRWF